MTGTAMVNPPHRPATPLAPACRALLLVLCVHGAAEADWVPFVIPHEFPSNSVFTRSGAAVPPRSAHVTVDNGHFALGGERYRVWGVNTCFGANLPTEPEAEGIARRLGCLGINSVRLHHLDTSPYPAGLLDPSDPRRIHPQAQDRLDRFVERLAAHGIRVNLNLHVGRRVSKSLGLPDPGTDYDKVVDLFTPALIDAQKDYARDLLAHTNRYRGVTWAADPAVAFVEITNEDSLFMWDAERRLRTLPPYYADLLQRCYAAWLRRTYRSTEQLRDAWAQGAEPLGTNMLANRVSEPGALPSWQLEVHLPAEASLDSGPGDGALRVRVRKPDPTDWHIQLKQSPLSLESGRYYTLAFKARATRNRTMNVGISMDHAPWSSLGFWHHAVLTTNWASTRLGFAAATNETRARLAFVVGGSDGDVEIAEVSLRPGGRIGLAPNETPDTALLHGVCETPARARDRLRFLAETERAYFDDMRRFIRDDLRCHALVTGTIVFTPLSLYTQGGMDYLDAHAYWQHPHFPGRPWDPADWVVEQHAMVDHPEWSTLTGLACSRLEGKPFTVSEYNHPAPNDYQAECVPLIAATAAAQDWDGVWLFAYSHRTGDTRREAYASFFDIDANPAKLAFVPAAAALYRDAAIAPFPGTMIFGQGPRSDPLDAACLWHTVHNGKVTGAFAASGRDPLALLTSYRLALSWRPGLRVKLPTTRPGQTRLTWNERQGKGVFVLESDSGSVWAGWSDAAVTSGVRVLSPAFAVITLHALDRRPLPSARRLLVTACGRCENTDMRFAADRRTVGRNWGQAPVRIEAVTAFLPLPPGDWRAQALGPDGTPGPPAEIRRTGNGVPELVLTAGSGTAWYLIERL